MGGSVAAGSCRGKTGTINGVSNLSGYCKSHGRLIAFSLLMNGVTSYDSARSIQDKMVIQIARYRVSGRWAVEVQRALSASLRVRPMGLCRPAPSPQFEQAGLVEDLDAELLGLGELRAGAVPGDHVVGPLRDRAGDLAAGALDQLGRPLAASSGRVPVRTKVRPSSGPSPA